MAGPADKLVSESEYDCGYGGVACEPITHDDYNHWYGFVGLYDDTHALQWMR